MKVLIYMPFAAWIPHLVTDLEIIANHLDKGDEVHIIQCSGDIPSCEPNPNYFKLGCVVCKSRRDRGLRIIGLGEEFRHELALHKFTRDRDFPEFSSIKELIEYRVDGIDYGMMVASTLISMVREPDPDLRLYKKFIENNLCMAIGIYDAISHHIEEIKPDIFYLFNGRYVAMRPALRASQDLGIKTFLHERAGVLDRYVLIEDTLPHDLKYQKNQIDLCWNDECSFDGKRDAASGWFEERRGGKDQSWHSYTKSQKKGDLPEGFDPSKRNIAIFISSEDEFEAISNWKNPIYRNQNEAIRNILKSEISEDIRLYLRIHPNLKGVKNTQTREIDEMVAPNLIKISPEDKIDSYQLMESCEKCIAFGSTLGIESVFWGRPSILVGRCFYEDLEGLHTPANHEELIALINANLDPPPKIGALKYGYWQSVYGKPFIYYSPESVRGGKFMGKYIVYPFFDRLKNGILNVDIFSRIIRNTAYFTRTLTWRIRRTR
ncbi:MAG: hypothetical protein SVY15_09220 [Halobacteriota archaeon]|nr:hypothetical protein [Halobacteriota archaeon]